MTTQAKSARRATFSGTASLFIAFTAASVALAAPATNQPAKPVTNKPVSTSSGAPIPSAGKAQQPQTGSVSHLESSPKPLPLTGKVESLGDQSKAVQGMVSRYKGSWQMFLQNPCHTGASSTEFANLLQGKVRWTFPAEGKIDSSPAIYKGVIYVGADDAYVYAVDEGNGRMLWRRKLGDKVKSSPAVVDGILM